MNYRLNNSVASLLLSGTVLAFASEALADTPGYGEKVVQWSVQSGETCEDVAKALYGSAKHKALVLRYNRVTCIPGAALKSGTTLVMPATIGERPTAKIASVKPDTVAKPPGATWSEATAGQPLADKSSVQTREAGRAGIVFADQSKVFLAEHTLVVIYGSASQSSVGRAPPAAVELKQGELQAGMAALRGTNAEVEIAGGGRVSAASRDAVIKLLNGLTTLSVFDGSADVSSAGRHVLVPTNQGTRFARGKPPEPPRPLPPAPVWAADQASSFLSLGGIEGAVLTAAWRPVPNAKFYRIEVARDAQFEDVIVREQVAHQVDSFAVKRLPSGRYHLRVRAIDGDDFLGVATEARSVQLCDVQFEEGAGSVEGTIVTAHRHSKVRLCTAPQLELSRDGVLWTEFPSSVDLALAPAGPLHVRQKGQASTSSMTFALRPLTVTSALVDGTVASLTVPVEEGVTLSSDVGLQARIVGDTQLLPVQFDPSQRTATVAVARLATGAEVEFLDRYGNAIARVSGRDSSVPKVTPASSVVSARPRIGLHHFTASPEVSSDFSLWSPAAVPGAAVALAVSGSGDDLRVRSLVAARAAVGPVGVDATVRTPNLVESGAAVDSSVNLGANVLAYRAESALFEFGGGLHAIIPFEQSSPSTRIEPALSVGGQLGAWTWLGNVGARIRVEPERDIPTDAEQAFVLAGATLDLTSWVRSFAMVDGSFGFREPGQAVQGRGGVSLGAEVGTWIIGSLSARVTPWPETDGYVSGQLSLGVRAE